MGDIIVDYSLDGSITVDYFGSNGDKKQIIKNIFDTLYELFDKKEVEETRFTRNVTGAFLTVYVNNDKKIMEHVHNFIETYVKDMEEFVDNEKKSNQHD